MWVVAPYLADTDGDVCTDSQELGDEPTLGGMRDPTDSWDYFNPEEDGIDRISDIVEVVLKFGEDEWLDPPTNSVPNPNYVATHDRGGQVGPNVWDQAPPDGTIGVPDIVAIVQQFGHDCA